MLNRTRSTLVTALLVGTLSSGCTDADGGDGHGAGGSGLAGTGGSPSGDGSGTGGGLPVESTFPDAQAYVDAHNAVRAAVVEPSGYTGAWEPLPPVGWSDSVAESAQEWANHLRDTQNCGLEHDVNSEYGENLAAGTNLSPQGAVNMWAAEAARYTYSPSYVFESVTGHYTQIVWRDSTRIGCASADCGRSSVIVCRYSPPGNFIGERIY